MAYGAWMRICNKLYALCYFMVSISPFWRASFFLSGMIMGVGMYGIPYVLSRAGFFLGITELILLSGATLLIHLMYGEIVLRTRQWHRLPGYAAMYGGWWAELIEIISYFVSFSGALAAYVLLGGTFLANVFSGAQEQWSYLFLGLGAVILFFGLRFRSHIDALTVALLGILIITVVGLAFPFIQRAHFETIDLSQWFAPYGVIMFAMAGMAAVPEMVGILEQNPRMLRRAIVAGTLFPAFLYTLFSIAVVGVSGAATTEEAIAGFARIVGPPALQIGSVIGILSTFGAFIALGSVFKSMLHLDLKIGWNMSWLVTVAIPFLFIVTGFRHYLSVIGFIGAVAIAVDGLMTIYIYRKAVLHGDRQAEYALHLPQFLLLLLALLFIFGGVYEFLF